MHRTNIYIIFKQSVRSSPEGDPSKTRTEHPQDQEAPLLEPWLFLYNAWTVYIYICIYVYIYIYILGSSARIARALAYGDILRRYITEIYYGRYITTDILRQIYYGKHVMADILRQVYYGRYITANTLWPIYCVQQ